jgi:HSP90 family molecular chaperone
LKLIKHFLRRQLAESSPYFEIFKKQNKEVVLVFDPADELTLLVMNEFQGKKIVSVEAFIKEQGIQTEKEQDGTNTSPL